jgi:hypothetical protein
MLISFANLGKEWLDAFVTDVVLTFLKNMFGSDATVFYNVNGVADKVRDDLVDVLRVACSACLSTGHVQISNRCFDVLRLQDTDEAEAAALRQVAVWVRHAFDELGIATTPMPNLYFHLTATC